MAGQADGSVYINTELDPEGFKAGSEQLKSAIKSLNTKVKELGPALKQAVKGNVGAMQDFKSRASELKSSIAEIESEMEALGNKPIATEQYASLTKSMDEAVYKLQALEQKQKEMKAQGVSQNSAKWQRLQAQIDEATRKVDTFQAACQNLQDNGQAFTPGSSTAAYGQLAKQLAAAKSQLADMEAKAAAVEKKAHGIGAAFKKIGKTVGTAAKTVGGALLNGLKGALSATKKLVTGNRDYKKSFSGMFSSIKKISLGLLGVRAVYGILRKAVSAYMDANQGLANQLSSCWTSLGNLLGPIITKIINLVSTAISYVTAFLKLLGMTGSAAADAVEGAGGAAEKAQKSLTGFDEINALQDGSSGGGGGGSSNSSALPDVTLPDWAQLMVEQIKAGDWGAAATTLATQLNNMIAGVDWAEIGSTIGRFFNGALTFLATFILEFDWYALGVSLGELINNIITNVDWANLGVVLGGKFIALIEGLGGLFATLDWTELGKALSDSLMGLWDAIDWTMVASTISNGIKGTLTTITEFLKNSDWEQIGEDIGTAFSEIDWAGIADCAFEAFNAAIAAIKGLLSGLPGDIIAIGEAFAAWKISSKLMTDLGTILSLPKSITVGISLAITGITLEAGGIEDAIRNELDGFNFAEIVSGALLGTGGAALIGSSIATWIDTAFAGSAIDLAITEAGINLGVGTAGAAGAALSAGFAGVILGIPAMFTGIYDACTNELDWLNSALTAAGGAAAGAGVGAICAAAGTAITPGIGTLIGLAVGLVADGIILIVQNWDTIVDFLSNFFTVTVPGIWNSFVTWITTTVPAWFKSLPGKIATWFDDLWQPIRDYDWSGLGYSIGQWFGNAVKDAIHFVTETVPNWLSDLWNSITSALSTFFTVTLPKFFTEWIPQAWESVKTFFSELPEKIWEAIQTGWNWLVDVGKSIIDGIWEGLQTVWTAITDFVSGFVQGFKDALGIHSPSTVFAEIGNFLIDGLLQGISETWGKITSFFSNTLSSLSTTISNGWNSIKTTTSNVWNNVKSSLSNTWSNIKSTASSTWSSMKSTASSAWSSMKSTATSTWSNIKSSLSSTWSSVKSTASSTWSSMKSTLSSSWSSIKSTTSSTWSSIKSSLSTTWSSIKSTASSTWSGIKSTIQNQGWSGVGSGITSGIKSGISNGWSTLTSWVSQKARSLLAAAKSALGIHSPSRLFRDEVGLNIGYGIGVGIENSEGSILDSVSGVANAIAEEFNAGDYKTGNLIPTAEVDGSLTSFSDTITDSFTALLAKLDAIAQRLTFTVPAFAGSVVPYKATTVWNSQRGSGAEDGNEDITRTMESTSNRQLALLREQNNLLRQLLDKDTNVTAVIGTSDVVDGLARKNRRDGKTVVPVGA